MSDRKRLFLALWPGPRTRASIASACAPWPEDGRSEAPTRWHLTLHYIGPVAAERLPLLAPRLAVPLHRFDVELTRIETWPRGIVVMSPDHVPPALAELHARLATVLGELDLPVEARPFRPHVTLARKAPGAAARRLDAPIRWPVRGYSLVVSDGAYRRVADYPAS